MTARAGKQSGFALRESVKWIRNQAPGVADLGIDGRTGGAEAEGQVTVLVHGGAAHPAPGRVRLIGALLENRHRAGGDIAQLEPTNARYPARTDGVISYDRFVAVGEFAIGQTVHEAIANFIQAVGSRATQLRHAGAGGGAEIGVTRRRRAGENSERRVGGSDEINVIMPGPIGVAVTCPRGLDEHGRGPRSRQNRTINVRWQWVLIGSSTWGKPRRNERSR